jgi:hypothetical protein
VLEVARVRGRSVVRLCVTVGPGASALVATRASAKAYAGATLVVLADPLVLLATRQRDAIDVEAIADQTRTAPLHDLLAGGHELPCSRLFAS